MATKNLKIDELSKALTGVSREDLTKLRSKINGLLELAGDGEKSVPADDWLFHGMVEELVSRGLLASKAVSSLQRTKSFRSYAAKADATRQLMLKHAPGLGDSQTVLRAFGRQLAYCLAESLSGWTTLTPGLMLGHVGDIPSAVDQCFPGYLSSGLLAKLVRVAQSA